MHVLPLILVLAASVAQPARSTAPSARAPADSLVARLRGRESSATRPRDAGEAALRLGQLFYARGEYRQAVDAFARAAAGLDPGRKSEALYWAGLSWLGLRSPAPARAAFAEVAASGSPRRAEALLGIASAWEADGRPDKAYETLQNLLATDAGEAAPIALARLAIIADRVHRPAEASRARVRLLEAYPASVDAAMAAATPAEPGSAIPTVGPVVVEAGRFASATRARSLASRARRAGFPEARVLTRGGDASKTFVVMLGSYPDSARAIRAQGRAAHELGLTTRMRGER